MAGYSDRGVRVANTVADIAAAESEARRVAARRAADSIADIGSMGDAHVRQILPDEDLVPGADNGVSGDARVFLQSGLSADSLNETYILDSDDKLEEKVLIIFAMTNTNDSPITTEIEFQSGTGGIFERVHVEGLQTDEQDTLLFADPVVFGATEDGTIEQYSTSAGDDEVILHGVVAEQAGRTLEPSQRFISQRG